jgi:hypothetical protein
VLGRFESDVAHHIRISTSVHILETNISGVKAVNEYQPYLAYVEVLESSHLLIYAGCYGGKFGGMTTSEKMGCNALFIRSDPATWYLQSFGAAADPKEFADAINSFVATKPHIKTITLAGFSMGAYGALLLATWVKCDRVVATAPQTRFPTYAVTGIVPTYPSQYGAEWSSIASAWQHFGRPAAKVRLQACSMRSDTELFNDIADCQHLVAAFPDVEIVWYDCVGHIGFQQITNSPQLPMYDASFW